MVKDTNEEERGMYTRAHTERYTHTHTDGHTHAHTHTHTHMNGQIERDSTTHSIGI